MGELYIHYSTAKTTGLPDDFKTGPSWEEQLEDFMAARGLRIDKPEHHELLKDSVAYRGLKAAMDKEKSGTTKIRQLNPRKILTQ